MLILSAACFFFLLVVSAVGSGVEGSSQCLSSVFLPCCRCQIQFLVSFFEMGLSDWPFLLHLPPSEVMNSGSCCNSPERCFLSTCPLSASSWAIHSSISFASATGSRSSFLSSSPSLCCCCSRLRRWCSLQSFYFAFSVVPSIFVCFSDVSSSCFPDASFS